MRARILLAALAANSCATMYPSIYWKVGDEELAALRKRAAFDLSCNEKDLTIVDLGAAHGAQQGVSGCEHKATYVLTNSGWVMNTDSEKKSNKEEGK